MPEAPCRTVYAQTELYPNSTRFLDRLSIASDFALADDGGVLQMVMTMGDIMSAYRMSLDDGLAVKPTA